MEKDVDTHSFLQKESINKTDGSRVDIVAAVREDRGSRLKVRLASVHAGVWGIVASAVNADLFAPLLRQSFPLGVERNGSPVFRCATAHE